MKKLLALSVTFVFCQAFALGAGAASPGAAGRDAANERHNILIISVDAMRPDHMSAYGYKRETTPNIDRLAERGVVFTSAYTHIPLTNPSIATLFTSMPPEETGVKRNGASLKEGLDTLPGVLGKYGYDTAAVVGCWALYGSRSGLEPHFNHYVDGSLEVMTELNARVVTKRAIKLFDQGLGEPFFLWAHYPDPHQPHFPQPGHEFAAPDGRPSNKEAVRDYYDSEIAYADHWIGVLLGDIERRGMLDNTIVVIMADHGEGLGENGVYGHGRGLYEPILKIPLIVAGPHVPEGLAVNVPVYMIDVAPSLVSYVLDKRVESMEGRDFTPAFEGRPIPEEVSSFFESYSVAIPDLPGRKLVNKLSKPVIIAMKAGDLKIIYTPKTGEFEIYDLASDPGEANNLADLDPNYYDILSDELLEWYRERHGKTAEDRRGVFRGKRR